MNNSKVHVKLDAFTIHCSAKEIADTFAWLLEEMRAATPRLRPDERAALRKIMSRESGSLTVGDVFPAFAREGEAHKTLRRLRAAQFIRPARSGRWGPDEPIELKPFGKLMWNRIGEAAIFNDSAGGAEGEGIFDQVPEAANAENDEIDLSRPDVNEPAAAETVRAKGRAAWEDDDVLDFLKDAKGRVG